MARVALARPAPRRGIRDLPLRIVHGAGFYRRREIDCLQEPEAILHELRDCGPDLLRGFPGVLSRIARAMTEDDRSRIRSYIESGKT